MTQTLYDIRIFNVYRLNNHTPLAERMNGHTHAHTHETKYRHRIINISNSHCKSESLRSFSYISDIVIWFVALRFAEIWISNRVLCWLGGWRWRSGWRKRRQAGKGMGSTFTYISVWPRNSLNVYSVYQLFEATKINCTSLSIWYKCSKESRTKRKCALVVLI